MKINSKMRCELVGSERISNYIKGGHAVVTLTSDSGNYYTYAFSAPKNRKSNEDTLFIQVLICNNIWNYVGMFKANNFHLTKASKYSVESPIVKGVAYIMKLMLKPGYSDDRMHLFHEGVCARCGRSLTNPDSLEAGIGPVCRDLL